MAGRAVVWICAGTLVLLLDVRAQEAPVLPRVEADSASIAPFGYQVFNRMVGGADTTFGLGPVDPGYPVGPGDEIRITTWGQVELIHMLTVDRDGGITIPKVGRLQVSGVPLGELQGLVTRFLSRAYSGIREDATQANTFVDVSLGNLRTIQVFVVGEVQRPGTYTTNATSTVLNALYLGGGPTSGGSLRNVRLVRHDSMTAALDFYRFILGGDKSEDVRLQNGDVVLVPPVGMLVTLTGRVHRPAIYELKAEEGLKRLIEIAGGLNPDAYTERVQIQRIVEHRERQIIDVDLSSLMDSGRDCPLSDGDAVTIFRIPYEYKNAVTIYGYVKRPGRYQLLPDMTVKGLIQSSEGILPEAYLGRADLVRTDPDMTKKIIPFNLGKALEGDVAHSLTLTPLDEITVYSIHTFGDQQFVYIEGLVRKPGRYELLSDMQLEDLIALAGGLQDIAYKLEAEIARSDPDAVTPDSPIQVFRVPISDKYQIDSSRRDGFPMQNHDVVFIRSSPDYEPHLYVTLGGEVRFPGVYSLRSRSERLTEIIERAGGLRDGAYPEGIEFDRTGTGVVAIDLPAALKHPGGPEDPILQDGDAIAIPLKPAVVRVTGEVYHAQSVLFQLGRGVDFYLERAGGLTKNAHKGNIYIVRANGETLRRSRFLFWRRWPRINPGSTIVVPPKESSALLRNN